MSIRDDVPTLEYIIQVMGPGDEKEGIYGFDQVIDRYNPAGLDSGREIAPDEIAAMFHTGGTTGSPKLALHTHWNEVHLSWALTVMAGMTSDDVLTGRGLPRLRGTHRYQDSGGVRPDRGHMRQFGQPQGR